MGLFGVSYGFPSRPVCLLILQVPYMGQFTGLLVQCSGYYTGILRLQVGGQEAVGEERSRLLD